MLQSTETGTLASTINYANVILKVIRIPIVSATTRFNRMIQIAEHRFFHNLKYSQFAISSCVSQKTVVITPFVGNVVALFFCAE